MRVTPTTERNADPSGRASLRSLMPPTDLVTPAVAALNLTGSEAPLVNCPSLRRVAIPVSRPARGRCRRCPGPQEAGRFNSAAVSSAPAATGSPADRLTRCRPGNWRPRHMKRSDVGTSQSAGARSDSVDEARPQAGGRATDASRRRRVIASPGGEYGPCVGHGESDLASCCPASLQ